MRSENIRPITIKGILISASVLAGVMLFNGKLVHAASDEKQTPLTTQQVVTNGTNSNDDKNLLSSNNLSKEPSNPSTPSEVSQTKPVNDQVQSDNSAPTGVDTSTNQSSAPQASSGSNNTSSVNNGDNINQPSTSVDNDNQKDPQQPSNLVVVDPKDNSVHIDNQLQISTDDTPTIKTVTSNNSSSYSYDEDTNTATITDPTENDTVTANYGVVGTYQNKPISAQVTVSKIIKHDNTQHIAPSKLPENQIQIKFHQDFGGGVEVYNVAQDELTIKYFDEANNQITINGDGYITIGSLNGPSPTTDGQEFVNYNNADAKVYLTKDSVVSNQNNPLTGDGKVYAGNSSDFTDELGAPTSENGAVTFQLSGDTFTFVNGTTRNSLKNKDHHWSYDLTTFSSATVFPATLPIPILSVDKDSAKAGDTVTYTMDQTVNTLGEDTLLHYNSWNQSATLPSEVTYKSGSLLDSNGQVITDAQITFDKDKNQVNATLPDTYLQAMTLDGETYKLKIVTTVNSNIYNGEVGQASGQTIVDNNEQDSETVSTGYVAPVSYSNNSGTISIEKINTDSDSSKKDSSGKDKTSMNIKLLEQESDSRLRAYVKKSPQGQYSPRKSYYWAYKREAPKPKGKWHTYKRRSYKVNIPKFIVKAGVTAVTDFLVDKIAVESKIPARYVSIGVGAIAPDINHKTKYIKAMNQTRSNKYVKQYKTIVKIYKDKHHRHLIKKVSRTQSFVKKEKLVKFKKKKPWWMFWR